MSVQAEAAGATPPRIVGPFRLESPLGQGGMGEVYRAYDQRLGRWVAMKHIRAEAADRPTVRARFRHEARAAAQLSHPGIVPIFDIVETEEGDWIVLELVEGPTLDKVLRSGPLPIPLVLQYGFQIAAGLAEAHSKGILHRDLKPSNIIISPSGHARILDFGLAKQLTPEGEDLSISVPGMILGTCSYMSPEQAQGLRLDQRSDLFSLGVLLHEMVTGHSPFRGSTTPDTLHRLWTYRPPPVHESRPEAPEALSDLIDQLLDKMPDGRPETAVQVGEMLAGLSTGSPGIPLPLSPRRSRSANAFEETDLGSADATRIEIPAPGAFVPLEAGAFPVSGERVSKAAGLRRFGLAAASVALLTFLATLSESPRHLSAQRNAEIQDTKSSSYELYLQGLADLERFDKQGHVDRAIDAFQRAAALDQTSAPAHAGLARAYWRQFLLLNDPALLEQAHAVARRAVTLDEHLAVARVSLGLIEAARGQHAAALEHLDYARTLDPANADAWRGLAEIFVAQNRLAEAESAFHKAVLLRPRDRELHDLLGELYYRTGRYREAGASFRRSIEAAPDSVFGYRNLAAAYSGEGRYEEATSILQKALQIQQLPSLYSNLGTILFFQGLYPEAVSAFERALETSGGSHNFRMWANLGDAYRWTPGNREKAREAYLQAIQMVREKIAVQQENVGLRSRLASYLAKRGDSRLALAELDRIGPIPDTDAESFYFTAVAYEIAGRRGPALEALGRALRAGFSLDTIQRDPELLRLRADPGYHRLMMKTARPASG